MSGTGTTAGPLGALAKEPTGISGLDEVTGGGLLSRCSA